MTPHPLTHSLTQLSSPPPTPLPLTHGCGHLCLELVAPLSQPLAHEGHSQQQRVLPQLLRRAALVHVADAAEHVLAKRWRGEGGGAGRAGGGGVEGVEERRRGGARG